MMGDGTTVKAIDLKVGSMVQTSDGEVKEVLGLRLEKVAGTADLFWKLCFCLPRCTYVKTIQPKGRVDAHTNTIEEYLPRLWAYMAYYFYS